MNELKIRDLKKLVPEFRRFLEADGQQWKEERREKDEFISRYFAEDEIEKIEEGTLRELIHILWAFNGWTNLEIVQNDVDTDLIMIRVKE